MEPPKRWPASLSWWAPNGAWRPNSIVELAPSPYLRFPAASAEKTNDSVPPQSVQQEHMGAWLTGNVGHVQTRYLSENTAYNSLLAVQYLPKAQLRETIFKKDCTDDVTHRSTAEFQWAVWPSVCLIRPVRGFLLLLWRVNLNAFWTAWQALPSSGPLPPSRSYTYSCARTLEVFEGDSCAR